MTDEIPIEIDGSFGEGGGQILRSSLSLSMITGRPLRVDNIRAGRKKPGLMRQHLTCVEAASQLVEAELAGASVGSSRLDFRPTRSVIPGEYHFRIGTAGSTSLVLQTVLPALLDADGTSRIQLEGGTHNKAAPPFEFLQRCFLPQLAKMGPQVTVELDRHGFYPAGAGQMTASIEPASELQPHELMERGKLVSRAVEARVSNLPLHIAQREVKAIQRRLQWPQKHFEAVEVESNGPGNILLVMLDYEHVSEVFSGFGEIGLPAEKVAKQVAKATEKYLAEDVPVGEYLADQLMLPMGICRFRHGKQSRFRTHGLSLHSRTHIELLQRILEIDVTQEQLEDGSLVIHC